MSKEVLIEELHKAARRNYGRRKIELKGIGDLWQADLVEMIPYSNVNKGFKYLLTVIDCFTKFAWVQPLKSKSGKDVSLAMSKILKEASNRPKLLQTDNGKEFYNKEFKSLLEKHKISLYSVYTKIKGAIVERFNRTLKSRMWKKFSLQGTYKWVEIVQSLVKDYNHTVHSTINMKPVEVTRKDEEKILKRLQSQRSVNSKTKPPRFKSGDRVRISKEKALFDKGYTPNWSNEQFTIIKVQQTKPVTYLLEDLNKVAIKGAFYTEELQKTHLNDVYLVEKVLRRKKDKSFVKWWGFDSQFNSWIETKSLS